MTPHIYDSRGLLIMIMNRLALGLAAVPLLIGGLGFAVPSTATTGPSALMAQNSTQSSGQRTRHHSDFAETLKLTDAQKTQLKAIWESARQSMAAVFTPAQKEQLRLARQQHQRPSLTLSEAQKAQIAAIRQDTRSKMNAVLTAEQQQQLQLLRQQHKEHHSQQ
jgi:Spy/CpxP family protein refolding chaperone